MTRLKLEYECIDCSLSQPISSSYAGRRSCLGEILARQEIFLFLVSWIQRFNIQPGTDGEEIDNTPVIEITMMPRPFTVRMILREA